MLHQHFSIRRHAHLLLQIRPRRIIQVSVHSSSKSSNESPTLYNRTRSTVEVGTTYEHLCARTLQTLGFQLTHTGGRSDRGIDLIGHWVLPSQPHSPSLGVPANSHHTRDPFQALSQAIPVVVQCKANATKPRPEMIRELAGSVAGAPGAWKGEGTIGVLCAKGEATPGLRDAVLKSPMGVIWVLVDEGGEGTGRVTQILWNERVRRAVGEGWGWGVRYLEGKGVAVKNELRLMWEGRVWVPEDEVGDGDRKG